MRHGFVVLSDSHYLAHLFAKPKRTLVWQVGRPTVLDLAPFQAQLGMSVACCQTQHS